MPLQKRGWGSGQEDFALSKEKAKIKPGKAKALRGSSIKIQRNNKGFIHMRQAEVIQCPADKGRIPLHLLKIHTLPRAALGPPVHPLPRKYKPIVRIKQFFYPASHWQQILHRSQNQEGSSAAARLSHGFLRLKKNRKKPQNRQSSEPQAEPRHLFCCLTHALC